MTKKKEPDKKASVKYAEFAIVTYSLKHLAVKDKVRFYYALKGRSGKKGIVEEYKIEQLGRTVFLVKNEQLSKVKEFLQYWKCKAKVRKVFIQI